MSVLEGSIWDSLCTMLSGSEKFTRLSVLKESMSIEYLP